MLSPGCGFGKHEINFAKSNHFKKILGFDISKKRVDTANFEAAKLGIDNAEFLQADINDIIKHIIYIKDFHLYNHKKKKLIVKNQYTLYQKQKYLLNLLTFSFL